MCGQIRIFQDEKIIVRSNSGAVSQNIHVILMYNKKTAANLSQMGHLERQLANFRNIPCYVHLKIYEFDHT